MSSKLHKMLDNFKTKERNERRNFKRKTKIVFSIIKT